MLSSFWKYILSFFRFFECGFMKTQCMCGSSTEYRLNLVISPPFHLIISKHQTNFDLSQIVVRVNHFSIPNVLFAFARSEIKTNIIRKVNLLTQFKPRISKRVYWCETLTFRTWLPFIYAHNENGFILIAPIDVAFHLLINH